MTDKLKAAPHGFDRNASHTCTPLALRLADILGCSALQCDVDAAAELRRLHAENIELAARVRVAESGFHAAVQTAKWQESTNSELNRHIAQKAELRAENEALRAALRQHIRTYRVDDQHWAPEKEADRLMALVLAQGEKT